MTHKEIAYVTQILQNHTNKVFIYDISQGYSIKVPRGTASIFSSYIRSLHNQRISEKTVRNRLRQAHLHACCPHRGLDLTAVSL